MFRFASPQNTSQQIVKNPQPLLNVVSMMPILIFNQINVYEVHIYMYIYICMRVCVLKNQSKSQQIKLNMVNNTNSTQGNIQLVVDPRVGVILGSVNQQQGSNLCKKHDSFIINLKSFVIGNTTTTAASPTSGVSTQSQTENVRRFELSICLSPWK